MKHFIAAILVLTFLFSFAGCVSEPAQSGSNLGSNNSNGLSQGGINPGGDDMLNSDGTLKIPEPDGDATLTVDADTWQTLLSEEMLRSAMLENSMTTITTENSEDQYQMYYCAGGRYGSILVGNYRSETICGVVDGTVYVFNRSAAEDSWTRTTYAGSYEEYVTNSYLKGPMQFFVGLDSAYDQAIYTETEKAYILENYSFSLSPVNMRCKLKVQFSGEKLYSITLYLNVEGESGALTTVFGAVSDFDLPTDFQSGNSGSMSVSPDSDHSEPPEAVCNERTWQQMFSQARVLDTLGETYASVKLNGNAQEYFYHFEHERTWIVISSNNRYQEIIMNRHNRFQRDSKNGQWLHYSDRIREYETVLQEHTAELVQLLTPLKDMYSQTTFDSSRSCFTLSNVSITHDTFGAVTADYKVVIYGGRLEKLESTIQTANGTFDLLIESDKDNQIVFPEDYVDVDSGKEPGKK